MSIVSADIEPDIGTAADDRQRLAARRNGACLHRWSLMAGLCNGESLTEKGSTHAGGKPQEARSRQVPSRQALRSGVLCHAIPAFCGHEQPAKNLDAPNELMLRTLQAKCS